VFGRRVVSMHRQCTTNLRLQLTIRLVLSPSSDDVQNPRWRLIDYSDLPYLLWSRHWAFWGLFIAMRTPHRIPSSPCWDKRWWSATAFFVRPLSLLTTANHHWWSSSYPPPATRSLAVPAVPCNLHACTARVLVSEQFFNLVLVHVCLRVTCRSVFSQPCFGIIIITIIILFSPYYG